MNLSFDPDRLVTLVRGITSDDPEERHIWADVPGYLRTTSGKLGGDDGPVLAAVLAWAALVETDFFRVRAGFLDSLDALTVVDLVPTGVLELVTSHLSRQELDIAEVEFYDTLVATLEQHRRDGRSAGRSGRLSMEPGRLLEMARGVTAEAAEQRRVWAAIPGQRCDEGVLRGDEASALAAVLAWATVIEIDAVARSGLLASLDSLARAGLVPTAALHFVTSGLSRSGLADHDVASYDALVTRWHEQRDPNLRIRPRHE
jgi:hypothetical protein